MIGPIENDAGMLLATVVAALWLGLVVWLTAMAVKKALEDE